MRINQTGIRTIRAIRELSESAIEARSQYAQTYPSAVQPSLPEISVDPLMLPGAPLPSPEFWTDRLWEMPAQLRLWCACYGWAEESEED